MNVMCALKRNVCVLLSLFAIGLVLQSCTPPDDNTCDEVPIGAAFKITAGAGTMQNPEEEGKNLLLTLTSIENNVLWRDSVDNETGPADIACIDEIMPGLLEEEEDGVPGYVVFDKEGDNETITACVMIQDFTLEESSAVATVDLVYLDDSENIAEAIQNVSFYINMECSNFGYIMW